MPGSWCFQKNPTYYISEFLDVSEEGDNRLEWVDLLQSS